MAKNRFSRTQNEALQQASLEEKFNLLNEWKETGEISGVLFNKYTNDLINKTMRKIKPESSIDLSDRGCCRSVAESEVQVFIDSLRNKLNNYLSCRDKESAKLRKEEIATFKMFLQKYPYLRSKINRLLILGLRFPDVRLNQISEQYIKETKINDQQLCCDAAFWLLLWEDGNLVPLNAIRLMLRDTGKGEFVLRPCFNKYLVWELLPSVQFQRDKEKLRLDWAKGLRDPSQRKTEVERKQKRLDFFNCLLEVMKKII